MPNKNLSDIHILLDNSGSMSNIWDTTIKGLNGFIKEQQAAPGDATITLRTFNNRVQTVKDSVPVRQMPPLSPRDLHTGGGTALLDSMAQTILEAGAKYNSAQEDDRAGRVLVVIITDGEENASSEWRLPDVKAMLRHQEEQFGWDFVFLGAAESAIKVGGDLGITPGKVAKFTASNEGAKSVFETISKNTSALRAGKLGEAGKSVEQYFDAGDRAAIDKK